MTAAAGQQLRSILCGSTALQGLSSATGSGGRIPQAKAFRLTFLQQQHASFQQRHTHQFSFCWQPWSAARSHRHLCSAAAGGSGKGPGEDGAARPDPTDGASSSGSSNGSTGVLTSMEGDIIPDSWEDVTDAGRIVPYELHREASESYLAYAMSVIVGRALPDVRDGLKPVHRRILFAMHELGMASNKPFRKCARVVGEVLGKYHPHGDTAVYDALVRLAQDFSMRAPLVDGHGNFGSLDNDPPAAMRYTECRLQQLSSASLLMDLDSDTVDMVPNFDGSQMEPSVLPARLPHLLVNGSSGIAVGIATKIPPHNMGEVVLALKALIADPSISTERLMSYVPAPDFPTGGVVLKGSGIRDAYGEGRGGFTLRGKVVVEEEPSTSSSSSSSSRRRRRGGERPLIVVTEIPYQTNKADLVTKISQLVNDRVIDGIADVRDESDREGMRVVVEVKNGTPPELVLNQLYHHTRLQVRFSCNMVALVDGRPVMLGLKRFLSEFLEWRCTVIQRRSQYEATKARTRLHLVEGFMAVLSDVDRAVKLIRAAPDTAAAGAELAAAFGLSKEQTKGVLNMTLGRLTNMEADKLATEMKSLQETIRDLDELVSSRERLLKVVEAEADEVVKKFGTPRRTAIELDSDEGSLRKEDIIPNEPSFVTLSKRGYVKRMKATTFQVQGRGGRGKAGARLKNDDAMENLIHAMDHDHMLFFSNEGIVYSIRTFEIPEAQRTAQGTPVTSIVTIPKAGAVTAVLSTAAFDENECLVMATTGGLIKKVKLSDFSKVRNNGLIAIKLRDGDSLAFVERCRPGSSVMVASDTGRLLHFDSDSLRPLSRTSMGVRSMKLKPGEKVVGMSILPPEFVSRDAVADDDEEEEHEVAEQDEEEEAPSQGDQAPQVVSRFAAAAAAAAAAVAPYPSPEDAEDVEEVEDVEAAVNDAPWILLITKQGLGKRTGVRHFSMRGRAGLGMLATRLRKGDSLAFMGLVGLEGRQPGSLEAAAPGSSPSSRSLAEEPSSGDIVAVSREGLIQRNAVNNIVLQGRYARGASLMRLQEDDEVIGATYAPSEVLYAAEKI